MLALAFLLGLASLAVLACATYLFVLAVFSRPQKPPPHVAAKTRFDFIVPAHNEAGGIGETVRSLLAVDYPSELRRVVVVADNCNDRTAARAKEAGAIVVERHDETLRGKGHALKFAFDRILREQTADVAVVVDADTLVSPNLLNAFAARFAAGAGVMQAEYGVRNPDASWRTRLMVIALATFHAVRSLGRARLRLSCGLRGNGMGFARQVLADVPYNAFSIVEDLEYGVQLARAGYAVEYVPEARVLGEMVSSERGSRSQRRRWESGRRELRKRDGWPLMRKALAGRDRLLVDIAMDLLTPPLTSVVGAACIGLAGSLGLIVWGGPRYLVVAAPWATAGAMLLVYVLRGIALSETGARGLFALCWSPVYILWKIVLSMSRLAKPRPSEWVRTAREDEKSR